ncbi:MAG TPA: metalloregulator ArsR/SmtB family transcription factor [Acidobacteriaceae bacterium]|jgi:DNA-binding transcriptional ArsR family regulator
MSQKSRKGGLAGWRGRAPAFAALGDATRLSLVVTLASGEPRSIAELTTGSRMTRQAITKHLRVLERVGMVRSERAGRESRFAFDPRPVEEMRAYLEMVSAEWDAALGRLKAFVEK